MQRPGGSATVAPINPDPMAYYSPEPPEPKQKPQPEPQPVPQPDPEQSRSPVGSDSYHLDFSGTDYLPSISGAEYTYDFELFGSYTPGPYPQHYGTPSAASSSWMPNEGPAPNDFLPIFTTPPPEPNDNVGRRGHPERDRRLPNRYTPGTTPSNHQF
ncbi:hypothetical protein V6Z11_D09G107300 [Gossypium hirsutum]